MALSDAPISIDSVTLAVNDLARTSAFYRDVVGLEPLASDGESADLGAGGRTLIRLEADAAPRPSPRAVGLFHTAFLVPSRGALGGFLRNAIERRIALDGASDHAVSEALYLDDPEGNGIEVYADRPRETWSYAADGTVAFRTDPLDLPALAAAGAPWTGAPDGTVVGHVHLKVADLAPAEAFWTGTVGLDVTSRYPGAVFLSSGGYHHHVAVNIWRSAGAKPVRDVAGLRRIALAVAPGVALTAAPLADPSGTPIEVRATACPSFALRAGTDRRAPSSVRAREPVHRGSA